jgi:type IV pilus assembly protein PilB
VPTLPLYPDRTQHHRDVRKELQETTLTAPLPQVVGQILERAFDCRATNIHFDCHLLGGSKPSPLGEGFSVALR